MTVIYRVRARFIEDKLGEFFLKLTDGTLASQKPDGAEIVDSMGRAKITATGVAEWTEKCFCVPPFKHERETVYDRYFTDFVVEEVDDYYRFTGEQLIYFMAKRYMEERTEKE